jgi:hypothetical protein
LDLIPVPPEPRLRILASGTWPVKTGNRTVAMTNLVDAKID